MLLLIAPLPLSVVNATASQKLIPVIIGFREKADLDIIKKHGGEVGYTFQIISAVAAKVPELAIELIKRREAYNTSNLISKPLLWGKRCLGE